MNNHIKIIVIVEGQTEAIFIKEILAPYLALKNIFISPTILSKPGQNGGDVRFSKASKDIGSQLKQRSDHFVTLFIDYYGTNPQWPGMSNLNERYAPVEIANIINKATENEINKLFTDFNSQNRFISNIAIHEFEALLFSDTEILSNQLNISEDVIKDIINECGEPEKINNSPQTAPSKRLSQSYSRYKKTTTGIAIAKAIGIEKMRKECFVFNSWLEKLEKLKKS